MQFNYDLSRMNVDLSDSELIPEGLYNAFISGTEMKDTKAGTGKYLSLEFTLAGNPAQNNRKVWTNLNLVNPNTKAVEIAEETLGRIMAAVGLTNLTDSSQLMNKQMKIKVVQTQRDGYDPRNEIKAFRKAEGFGGNEQAIPF